MGISAPKSKVRFRQLRSKPTMRNNSSSKTGVAVFQQADWLEIKENSPLTVISAIKVGLPFSRFESLQEVMGLPANQLAAAIKLPASTLARQKKSGQLTSDQSERLVRLARVMEMAFDLFEGDKEAARRWFKAPREALGGNTPLEMVSTEIGAREVENLIDRLQDGIFS